MVSQNVTYWPSTEPSIKRCTCVNKRKNSGSGCTLNNNITRALTVSVSWRQDAELRANVRKRALVPQWPTVEQPHPRWGISAAMVRRTLGQNSSLSPSPAHLPDTTNINLSRIKCESYILSVFVRSLKFVIIVESLSAYICIIFTQPLRSGRIWHKVKF